MDAVCYVCNERTNNQLIWHQYSVHSSEVLLADFDPVFDSTIADVTLFPVNKSDFSIEEVLNK